MIEFLGSAIDNYYAILLGGLLLLTLGCEVLVQHASGLAMKSNISPLIVGLSVIAIRTLTSQV